MHQAVQVKRLIIHVEGRTEEQFVKEVLAPHLFSYGFLNVTARLLGNPRQRINRGGIQDWHKVKKDIVSKIKYDPGIYTSMMVDYYGLPDTWPGIKESKKEGFDTKASIIEQAIFADLAKDLGNQYNPTRFIPYIVTHEFEGLLFSDCDTFAIEIGKKDLAQEFQKIRKDFASPEEINDNPQTAPSKRIKNLFPGYQKPSNGIIAVKGIGLNKIRQECALFNAWLSKLEELGQK